MCPGIGELEVRGVEKQCGIWYNASENVETKWRWNDKNFRRC